MSDKKLRWGILSTAKIGTRAVIPAMQRAANGIITAIASRDLATAQDAAKALNIPRAFGSYEAMLDDPDIDAIYNPLPNSMHREWTIRAAERGKHILCEKPLALNIAEIDEMIAAAQQQHVLLMEAFMYRFHPQFARVKQMIAEGAIGKVRIIRSAFCYTMGRPNDIRAKKEMGGGALMDVGCYCVNMSRLIAGAEPIQVQANGVFDENQVDWTMAGLLRFPGDMIAVFDCGFQQDYSEWLEIQGTRGRLDVPRPVKPMEQPAEIILHSNEGGERLATRQTITVPGANHYQLQAEHFADAVLNGKPLLYPPEDARANMRAMEGLFVSANGI